MSGRIGSIMKYAAAMAVALAFGAALAADPCTVEDWSKVVPYSYIDSDREIGRAHV